MIKRIRVLQIISGFAFSGPSGGQGQYGVEIARRLDQIKFDVNVCGLWFHNTDAERRAMENLRITGVNTLTAADWDENHPYKGFIKAAKTIITNIVNTPVDIIHSHSEFSDVIVCLIRFIKWNLICIRTVHNREWVKRPFRRLLLTNILYPFIFDLETGVSQSIVKALNIRPIARRLKKISIQTKNSIDISKYSGVRIDPSTFRSKLGISEMEMVVGSIGRLTKQKGYEYFIRAARVILYKRDDIHFILIGAGELEKELKNLVAILEIQNNFHLLGPVDDVVNYMSNFDLFVSTSLWEGLPTVILESMASGVPVIASDIPGVNEIINHGENGLLISSGDIDQLSEIILMLLGDTSLRDKLVKNAFNTVSNFSISEQIRNIEINYEILYKNR